MLTTSGQDWTSRPGVVGGPGCLYPELNTARRPFSPALCVCVYVRADQRGARHRIDAHTDTHTRTRAGQSTYRPPLSRPAKPRGLPGTRLQLAWLAQRQNLKAPAKKPVAGGGGKLNGRRRHGHCNAQGKLPLNTEAYPSRSVRYTLLSTLASVSGFARGRVVGGESSQD